MMEKEHDKIHNMALPKKDCHRRWLHVVAIGTVFASGLQSGSNALDVTSLVHKKPNPSKHWKGFQRIIVG